MMAGPVPAAATLDWDAGTAFTAVQTGGADLVTPAVGMPETALEKGSAVPSSSSRAFSQTERSAPPVAALATR